ncbi:MAG: esterase/lipase family protein [Micavibrio sp.]
MITMPPQEEQTSTPDTIVLLHGIGHTRLNMLPIEWALSKRGYRIVNITYPSRQMFLADLGQYLDYQMINHNVWSTSRKVHFVTHSMGGLVVQNYLYHARDRLPRDKIGRVVMLAPPIRGSEVADLLRDFLPYRWIFGPAGQELTTDCRSERPIAAPYELGIIAGNLGWPYIIAHFLFKGPHDGRVSVKSTQHPDMKDHLVISSTHSFISWNRKVHEHIAHFLMKGEFSR